MGRRLRLGYASAVAIWLLGGLALGEAPPRKPNILVILADDLGFSDIGAYGGEIATPNLDRLAANGLRFTQFYNTARCWPTRTCLLTGYYAQQVRMDPPKDRLPKGTRVLPHYLKPLGYRSYHVGKWHLLGAPKPAADGGFDASYWFQDWDRYFTPAKHFENDQQLPAVGPADGYYATTAFADNAIKYLKDHAANHRDRPFFLYLAFVAPHFPLHAPEADVARYSDRYRLGWDELRRRRWNRLRELGIVDGVLPPADPSFSPRYLKPEFLATLGAGEVQTPRSWQELTPDQQRFQATKMAVHAAMVDRMDREIGRVLDQVRTMGAYDDTLILFLSDNGADSTIVVRGDGHDPAARPGSARSFLCLGPGWATASNTPFRWHKIWVHEGGIATPLIAHWPNGIRARGELRRQVGHVIDFVPTFLALAGGSVAQPPDAPPLPGRSLLGAFDSNEPIPRDYLFFHHEGNRALRVGDWKLVSARERDNTWELYDLSRDRTEMTDLARHQPDRVRSMVARWEELSAGFGRDAARP